MLALGSFVGPLCAGFAIDHFGHARTYLFLSVLPVLPVLAMAAARNIKGQADDGAAAQDRRVMDLLRSKPLLRVLIVGGIILTGIDLFQFYMPIYGHSIGLSASAIGVIISMFAAAAFAVRLVIPPLVARMGEERLLNLALFIGAGAYLLMPLFTGVAALCAITFVFGLGLGLGQPLSVILTFSHSPQGRSGEALGLRLTINNFMHVAVPVVFGTIGSLFGLVPVFWTNALLLAGSGIYSRPRPS
jgi:MFS family permease